MKIPQQDCWSMQLSDYNLTFIHIRGTDNILVDTISRVKILEIYTELLENPRKVALNTTEECIGEVVANKIQILNTDRLHAEQKKDTNCRNLAAQLAL